MNFDNPFQKQMEMWQEFGRSYTENMFAMFEKSLEQSQAMQEQVQTAVSKAVDDQFAMMMSSMKSMEQQMAEMTKMMQDMMQMQKDE